MKLARRRYGQAGFSLLEAIVAMVLISGAGLAIFAWINSSLDSFRRVQEANLRAEATANILEYMHTVNPMVAPDGHATLGRYAIRWRSDAEVPPANGIAPGGSGPFLVGLYRVDVAVSDAARSHWFDLQLRQVGFKRTAPANVE